MGERTELLTGRRGSDVGYFWIRSPVKEMEKKRRVGVVGFGHLGRYLVEAIQHHPELELAFVWNRTKDVFSGHLDPALILDDLLTFHTRNAHLIVEVCHPCITEQYGDVFLTFADYMIGSPTALANKETEDRLREAALYHGVYVPSGALWGGDDIKKMADRGTLESLKVTMKKHPSCFKLEGDLKTRNLHAVDTPSILYEGPVRQLCPLAPNNVNSMAAAAVAGHNLGFDKVQGCLVADPSLADYHIVEVEVTGPGKGGKSLTVNTVRKNPASFGAVTGSATYASFFSSVLGAQGKGPGIHLC